MVLKKYLKKLLCTFNSLGLNKLTERSKYSSYFLPQKFESLNRMDEIEKILGQSISINPCKFHTIKFTFTTIKKFGIYKA